MSINREIGVYQEKLSQFAKEREWEKFHTPKNIASALSVEASELLEIFQWLNDSESRELSKKQRSEVRDEVADVFFYLIRFCDLLDIDFKEAIDQKFIKNRDKYPAEVVKGSSKKYTEY